MNEIMLLVLVILCLLLAIPAYLVAIPAIFSQRCRRTRWATTTQAGRSFLAGVVNIFFFGVVALVLSGIATSSGFEVFNLLSLLVLIMLLGGISIGLAALNQNYTERLFTKDPTTGRGFLTALLLTLACLAPLVGWFLLLPYLCLVSFGAFFLSFFQRQDTSG